MDAAVFGLIVADVLASPLDMRNPPASGGLQIVEQIELAPGGNVCNAGIAMAKLGLNVAAAGIVGRDVLGSAVIDRLKQAGVDVACVFADDRAQTSATVVAVEPGGERSFFHVPGATTLLDAAMLRRCFDLFARCAFVQIGYLGLLPALTTDLPALLPELRKAAPRTKIAFDTVNPPGPREQVEAILPQVDIFCPSRTEAAALTGEIDPPQMVKAFRRHMKQGLIAIKLDADGCYLDDGERAVTVPAYKIDVVDTTGAGDTWFGALLVALHRGMPLEQAGRFANRAAADCCTALGASAGVKSFEDTLARV